MQQLMPDKLAIGIVGLGLMGGSFALAMQKYNLSKTIIGLDHNKHHTEDALKLGLVDSIASSLDELKNLDLIILAIPVDSIIACMRELKSVSPNTTVIDFGGTKKQIVENIPKTLRANFIPAHPMTGTEKSGPKASLEGLYEDKIMVLCDIDKCGSVHSKKAIHIFDTMQMNIVYMDSTQHDIHASYISHLPHAISFALASVVMKHEDPKHIISLASGGFRDMSRIAKSSPAMWTDIFRQNKTNLLDGIEIFQEQMTKIKEMLKEEDFKGVYDWIYKANKLHKIL